jgi:hypothetical protein
MKKKEHEQILAIMKSREGQEENLQSGEELVRQALEIMNSRIEFLKNKLK